MTPLEFILGAAFLLLAATALWLWRSSGKPLPQSQLADYETKFIDVNGWTFRYHQSGQGPHLVLIHGIGSSLFCWRWITPLLRTHFTVTTLDLPGFGQSSKTPHARYGLDEQVERLNEFLNQLRIERPFLVGNSMGGNIALWFCLKYPDQAQGVTVIAPATSPKLIPWGLSRWVWLAQPMSMLVSRPAMRWLHQRTVSKRHLIDRTQVEETFRTYGRQSPAVRSFLLATEAIRDLRLARELSNLKKPVLILWGSRDRLVSRAVIEALEAALPEAESHVHMGGGHHLQEDEPEWVADKITTFFLD